VENVKDNKSLHLTANSSAIFAMLCPASKQVVIQGQCPAVLAAGEFRRYNQKNNDTTCRK